MPDKDTCILLKAVLALVQGLDRQAEGLFRIVDGLAGEAMPGEAREKYLAAAGDLRRRIVLVNRSLESALAESSPDSGRPQPPKRIN